MAEVTTKKRKRIPQETKIRAELQQECNSSCPFCDNRDAGHFEIHHIDENPANNLRSNLILICPTCHSKISKREVSQNEVQIKKKQLSQSTGIEIASINIDKSCSWLLRSESKPAFYYSATTNKSPFPVLNVSLINNINRTLILTAIHIRAKSFFSGFGGEPKPQILKASAQYCLPISYSDTGERNQLEDQLEIPASRAFKFQLQLYDKGIEGEILNITGRNVLFLKFIFNDRIEISAPNIYFNCKSENDMLQIAVLA